MFKKTIAKKLKTFCVIITFCSLLITSGLIPNKPVLAAENWNYSSINLQGMGFVTGLYVHPTEQNVVYASTDVGGAYRWDNANSKWINITDKLKIIGVDCMALDKSNSNIVYLVGSKMDENNHVIGNLYKSNDRGDNWTEMTGFPSGLYINANGKFRYSSRKLAVDPNAGGTVLFYGTRREGLYRSIDSGTSWTQVSTASIPVGNTTDEGDGYNGLQFVVFDESSGNSTTKSRKIYVGDQKTGVYISTNGGISWSLTTSNPVDTIDFKYRCVSAAINASGVLFVTYTSGKGEGNDKRGLLYKFTNGVGTNITPTNKNIDSGFATVDVVGTKVITNQFTCTDNKGIHYSEDSGETWTQKSFSTRTEPSWFPTWVDWTWSGTIRFNPLNTNEVWMTTGYATYMTNTISGTAQTWISKMNGLEELCSSGILVPPVIGGAKAFLLAFDQLGFRETNYDNVPAETLKPGQFGVISSADYCTNSPEDMVIVGCDYGSGGYLRTSTDNGASWTDKTVPSSYNGGNIAMSASDPNKLVWAPRSYYWGDNNAPNNQLAFSSDGGVNWYCSSGFPIKRNDATEMYSASKVLAADRVNGNNFYYYSTTSGDSSSYLYKSIDGGKNWSLVNSTLPVSYQSFLYAVPGKEGHLIYHKLGGGLYRSINSGTDFTAFSTSISNVKCLGFGKSVNGTDVSLFVLGTVNGDEALYQSIDNGSSWVEIADNDISNIPIHQVNSVSGDLRDASLVVIGTGGRGYFYGVTGSTTTPAGRRTGSVIREYWTDVSGLNVTDIPVGTTPTGIEIVTQLYPSSKGDNYGERIKGYIRPQTSGNYTFYISSDDSGEFWLSTNDNPANKSLVCYNTSWTNVDTYNTYSSQTSVSKALVAGQDYYFEILHKEQNGGDHVQVAWSGPGITQQMIETGNIVRD